MLIQLSPLQARIIGVLLEKEVTTPDQYPLSLNALTLGCNQKSNRDPVLNLSESEVQNGLDELKDKKQILEYVGSGSRVVKYKHRFCNTEFSDLKFSRQQLAIICLLLLRGPQTPGELRTRSNRLAEFANVEEVESTLNKLHDLNDQQLVTKLAREPGKRDSRYAHLFSGHRDNDDRGDDRDEQYLPTQSQSTNAPSPSMVEHDANSRVVTTKDQERISKLEHQVAALTQQLAELKEIVEILSE